MSESDVQKLSAAEALRLIRSLSCCYLSSLIPGNDKCKDARQSVGATPVDVGKGKDTLPDASQRFATVCETCPVLLNGFA